MRKLMVCFTSRYCALSAARTRPMPVTVAAWMITSKGWAVATFGERFCGTSSFADAVLAHVASRVAPGVDVVFLDTGLHFAETLRVREVVRRTLPVTVRSVEPGQTVSEQAAEYGPRLWARDP